jgi:hypothetical protein
MTDGPANIQSAFSDLVQKTVIAFKAARGDEESLAAAVTAFHKAALTAGIPPEEIENALGVNENCIMDLAELSEADEEILITTFEEISNT